MSSWIDAPAWSRKHEARQGALVSLCVDYAKDGTCWEWSIVCHSGPSEWIGRHGEARGCLTRAEAKQVAEEVMRRLDEPGVSPWSPESAERSTLRAKLEDAQRRRLQAFSITGTITV